LKKTTEKIQESESDEEVHCRDLSSSVSSQTRKIHEEESQKVDSLRLATRDKCNFKTSGIWTSKTFITPFLDNEDPNVPDIVWDESN